MFKYRDTSPSGCVVVLLALLLIIPYACGGSIFVSYVLDGFLLPLQEYLLFGVLFFGLPLIFVTVVMGGYTFARGRILLAVPVGLALAVVVLLGIYGVMYGIVMKTRPDDAVLQAMAPACQQQAVPEAGADSPASAEPAHLVLLNENGGAHMWTGKLPAAWRPASVSDTQWVACASGKPERVKLETCTYILGPSIIRYKDVLTVTIVTPRTGAALTTFAVEDAPRKCMSTEKREVRELHGKVTFEMLRDRLQQYVTR